MDSNPPMGAVYLFSLLPYAFTNDIPYGNVLRPLHLFSLVFLLDLRYECHYDNKLSAINIAKNSPFSPICSHILRGLVNLATCPLAQLIGIHRIGNT